MKKYANFLLLLLIVTTTYLFSNDGQLTEDMKKLKPFVGKWKTRSIYPEKGLEVSGDLEYRWILGKNWMLVEFVGKHPERAFWEAYAMIKFDKSRNCYISYDFFNANDPIIMAGIWISPKTLRFETENGKGKSGIDYTLKKDGTIFQENWFIPKNKKKKITLKTFYTK